MSNPSAFVRAAVEKDLHGADAASNESEQRIIASLEKQSKQIRQMTIGQQALFAYVDALAKVILSTLPGDGRRRPESGSRKRKASLLTVS